MIRIALFKQSKDQPTNTLYDEFHALKVNDQIKLDYAKFMHKFSIKFLPPYLVNCSRSYFKRVSSVYFYESRNSCNENFFLPSAIQVKTGRNI